MAYGALALDLANYYLTSEQIPTSFSLSLQFDAQSAVQGAGGLMLQAMPGANPDKVAQLEAQVKGLPSIGRWFSRGKTAQDFIGDAFEQWDPQIVGDYRVEFMCHCNEKRIRHMLLMLPLADLKDMADRGPFPIEIVCHNCSTPYRFAREVIQALYAQRYPSN